MPRHAFRTFLIAAVTALLVAAGAAPAAAGHSARHTTGHESFFGFILTSGASGERQVVASGIVAKGVFTGIGRIVEVPNAVGEPDNVSHDDLVFRAGTAHLTSTTTAEPTFSLDPVTCRFTVTVQQTGVIEGGTGVFAHAVGHFDGSVRVHGLAARNPDRSCSEQLAPLLELDIVMGTGSLTL
jgi:hypothetical protein